MKLFAYFLFLLLAPAAFAHPLDDRAQMASEVVLVSDQRLEFVLHFRYIDALASLSEVNGNGLNPGLDANRDGVVSASELKRRFNDLVFELTFPISITVDGAPITLEASYDRFLFDNMDSAGPVDIEAGVAVDSLRIHYRFVFTWQAPAPLAPGDHAVEYSFNSQQSVVHTPTEQMTAFDARVEPRVRIADITHESVGLPRMRFKWLVDPTEMTTDPALPELVPRPSNTMAMPEMGDCIVIGWEAWAMLGASILLTLLGAAYTLQAARKKRKSVVWGVATVVLGLAALIWMLNVVRILQF